MTERVFLWERRSSTRIMVSHCTTIFALSRCHRDERRVRKAVRVRWNGSEGPKEVMHMDSSCEPEGSWGKATVSVDDEGGKGASQGDAVGAVLGLLVAFAC